MSRRLMRNVISGLVLATCSFSTLAGNKWNGAGKITQLNIYPGYAIVFQGNVGGVTNCSNSNIVSFHWSDFTPEVQDRIMHSLLHAYSMKSTVEFLVDDTNCGPEGFKKFTGQIAYR